MALSHRSLPQFGVQFHPESIMSEEGFRLVYNFARIAFDFNHKHQSDKVPNPYAGCPTPFMNARLGNARQPQPVVDRPPESASGATSSATGDVRKHKRNFGCLLDQLGVTNCDGQPWKLFRKTIDTRLAPVDAWEHLFYDPKLPSAFLDSSPYDKSSSSNRAVRRADVRFTIIGAGLEA